MKKLSLEQMEKIEGGVSVREYCETLDMIVKNNDLSDGALLAARQAAGMYCGGIL